MAPDSQGILTAHSSLSPASGLMPRRGFSLAEQREVDPISQTASLSALRGSTINSLSARTRDRHEDRFAIVLNFDRFVAS